MDFRQSLTEDYLIFAGSLELVQGQGFLSAVAVHRRALDAANPATEVFRDMALSGGHKWPTSEDALQHALAAGRRAMKPFSKAG